MNILDENIIENQCQLLIKWRISFRQIGLNIGQGGMSDADIITLLHQKRNLTFFTRDDDFFKKNLCHKNYCIVYLAIRKEEAAYFIRRFLSFQKMNTIVKRMGTVVKVSPGNITQWYLNLQKQKLYTWTK